ncbi:MAG: 1-acyl-sn-glycerol-3-phosphate acyltransferase [Anaerolineales bacterium]
MNALAALTEINLDDLVNSFGWQDSPALKFLLRRLCHAPAQKFARRMLAFDARVGELGLVDGAKLALQAYAADLQLFGAENIPARGPALFLSNHPGMVDTLALFAAIARPDLKIIAMRRPFLQALNNTSRSLLYLGETPAEKISAIRQAAAHLKAGGAALTFPAGKIDPDPAVYPGAEAALQSWSDSAAIFQRLAPETQILPVLVRGVLWEKAVKHALTRLKKEREEREKLGAALQLLAHVVFDLAPLRVQIYVGPPLRAENQNLHASLLTAMRGLLEISQPKTQ